MKPLIFLIICMLGSATANFAQVNVQLLHQLVAESKSENAVQNEARNRQAVTTTNENLNRTQMERLKTKYRELQSRFKTLGLAIDAAQIGIQAIPVVDEIIDQQSHIFQLAAGDPLLIALALDAESDLAGQAYSLSNYLYGLAISIGDLNQMKPSDRKILFGHVLTELRRIAGASKGLAASMYYSSRKKALESMNPFGGFVNEDKRLVGDIMRRVDLLKQP